MKIGEATKLRILELCKDRNITINKLATISGIKQSTINNITSSRNKGANIRTIKMICDGLNITIQDFFNNNIFNNLEKELQ